MFILGRSLANFAALREASGAHHFRLVRRTAYAIMASYGLSLSGQDQALLLSRGRANYFVRRQISVQRVRHPNQEEFATFACVFERRVDDQVDRLHASVVRSVFRFQHVSGHALGAHQLTTSNGRGRRVSLASRAIDPQNVRGHAKIGLERRLGHGATQRIALSHPYGRFHVQTLNYRSRVSAGHADLDHGAQSQRLSLFTEDHGRINGLVGSYGSVERGPVSFLQVRATKGRFFVVFLCVAHQDLRRWFVAVFRLSRREIRDHRHVPQLHRSQFINVQRFHRVVTFSLQVGTGFRLLKVSRRRLRFNQVLLVRRENSGHVRTSQFALSNHADRRRIKDLTRIRRGRFISGHPSSHRQRVVHAFLRFAQDSRQLRQGDLQLVIQGLSSSHSFAQRQYSGASLRN